MENPYAAPQTEFGEKYLDSKERGDEIRSYNVTRGVGIFLTMGPSIVGYYGFAEGDRIAALASIIVGLVGLGMTTISTIAKRKQINEWIEEDKENLESKLDQ